MTLVAYLADAWVLATYLLTARGRPARWFHWANAVGAGPIAYTEVVTGAFAALVLTVTFGLIGAYGVLWRR